LLLLLLLLLMIASPQEGATHCTILSKPKKRLYFRKAWNNVGSSGAQEQLAGGDSKRESEEIQLTS
jgi:hypothetical protein